jgi:hypothetical protein
MRKHMTRLAVAVATVAVSVGLVAAPAQAAGYRKLSDKQLKSVVTGVPVMFKGAKKGKPYVYTVNPVKFGTLCGLKLPAARAGGREDSVGSGSNRSAYVYTEVQQSTSAKASTFVKNLGKAKCGVEMKDGQPIMLVSPMKLKGQPKGSLAFQINQEENYYTIIVAARGNAVIVSQAYTADDARIREGMAAVVKAENSAISRYLKAAYKK